MEQVLQFILSLSILIVLHELGHFIPAKLFKTRVEKFFLFFDPKFALFKKKIGETTYGIGWLPLGGYVKISGMVDESMDTESLAKEPEEWEFRAKPAWQRLIIITGGVIVNFILGIIIYAGIMSYYGEEYLPISSLKYGVTAADSLGLELGIESGDQIISINGNQVERFSEIPIEVLLADEGGSFTVERNNEIVNLPISSEFISKLISKKSAVVAPRLPFIAGSFSDSSAAQKAGLKLGDSLIAINGQPFYFYDEYLKELPKHRGDTVTLTAVRNHEKVEISFSFSSGKMGVGPVRDYTRFYPIQYQKYQGFDALKAGWNTAGQKLSYYVRQFKVIFNPETNAYKEVGGFVTMAKQFDSEWNWRKFWEFTAFLSLMLGFLNILPIPALDGGHMVFILYEMVSGRTPSTKFLEKAQMVGFFLLLALLLFANGNDIIKLIQ